MKNMKTAITFILVFAFCTGMCSTVLAADEDLSQLAAKYQLDTDVVIDLNDTTVSESNAESWAYMDYSAATATEKARILKARSIMMEQTDWVLDGYKAFCVMPDGITEELPAFSEVFPGWDITQIWAYRNEERALLEENNITQSEILSSYNGLNGDVVSPQLQEPNPGEVLELKDSDTFTKVVPVQVVGQNAPILAEKSMWKGVHKYVVVPAYMTGIDKCNIGFSMRINGDDASDIGFKQDMPAMSSIVFYSIASHSENDSICIRASTSCSQNGWVTFWYYCYEQVG